MLRENFYTDIQLKPLRRSIEGFHMKIIMRRDCVIFYIENNAINNAVKAVSFELKSIVQFEKSIRGGK